MAVSPGNYLLLDISRDSAVTGRFSIIIFTIKDTVAGYKWLSSIMRYVIIYSSTVVQAELSIAMKCKVWWWRLPKRWVVNLARTLKCDEHNEGFHAHWSERSLPCWSTSFNTFPATKISLRSCCNETPKLASCNTSWKIFTWWASIVPSCNHRERNCNNRVS